MTATSARTTSLDLLELLLDPGSFRCWDVAPQYRGPSPGYLVELADAAARSGADEAVRTGEGTLNGHPVAVICSEFRFLGGSIGAATADRIVAAIEGATTRGLPLLALAASGGTRMQEGTPAFLRMADIAAAVAAHKAAGLLYVVHLRHPTTGGVLASWGSLGHVTFAEPGALVGFLGPKVHAALHGGVPLPVGVQTAENLLAHDLIDGLIAAGDVRPVVARILDLLARTSASTATPSSELAPGVVDDAGSAWAHLTATRRADRPGLRDLLRIAASETMPLGREDAGSVLALTRLGRSACVVVGQDRHRQRFDPIGPAALRTVRRGLSLATALGLPLVAVIDTPGAELSVAAEEGGLAAQIAGCLADLLAVPVPTVSVLLGQGCGGAAIALLPADRVLAARHAWLTPLPPEGAATIIFGRPERAPDAAESQRIGAADLRRVGGVDRIIDERPDAADEPVDFCRRVVAAIDREISELRALPVARRLADRRERTRGR